MPGDEIADELLLLRIFESFEIDHLKIASLREIAFLVDDVRKTTAHTRCEVPARPAQHNDAASGHVFATMIAHAFDHRNRAAVTDRKALARDAADQRFTRSCAIGRDVTDNDVLFRALNVAAAGGKITMRPPERPFPK